MQRCAQCVRDEGLGVGVELPDCPYGVSQVFERHVQPDPAVRLWFLSADSARGLQQFFAPCGLDPDDHGDVVLGEELGAAFGPYAVEVNLGGAFGQVGQLFGGHHAREPVGAVLPGLGSQKVGAVADGDKTDRINGVPAGLLVWCGVVEAEPVSGEHSVTTGLLKVCLTRVSFLRRPSRPWFSLWSRTRLG